MKSSEVRKAVDGSIWINFWMHEFWVLYATGIKLILNLKNSYQILIPGPEELGIDM